LDDLDHALARFQLCDVEYGSGLANHGPMAAESLVVLGHEALIPALVDVYAPRLRDFEPGRPLPAREWEAALGRAERSADWIATFESELAAQDWRSVLARWLPELLPGLFAAATHGLLRTAHAVRALEVDENAVRVRELAFGLGYWASRYRRLPGTPGASPRAGHGPAELLRALSLVPVSRRRPGLLSAAVGSLDADSSFEQSVAAVDLDAQSSGAFLSELACSAAELYLLHPELRIVYAHCVTSTSALRLLDSHLDPADGRRAGGYALHAVAALHATHGRVAPSGKLRAAAAACSAEVRSAAESPAEVRYRAACSVEEHSIKLTEACLREDEIRRDQLLRLAAADAALEMGTSHAGRGG
jgi:hypothetical protein